MRIKQLFIVILSTIAFCHAEEVDSTEGSKKTVLITGAKRRLGLELSRQFAVESYDVIRTAHSPEKVMDLKEVAKCGFGSGCYFR